MMWTVPLVVLSREPLKEGAYCNLSVLWPVRKLVKLLTCLIFCWSWISSIWVSGLNLGKKVIVDPEPISSVIMKVGEIGNTHHFILQLFLQRKKKNKYFPREKVTTDYYLFFFTEQTFEFYVPSNVLGVDTIMSQTRHGPCTHSLVGL